MVRKKFRFQTSPFPSYPLLSPEDKRDKQPTTLERIYSMLGGLTGMGYEVGEGDVSVRCLGYQDVPLSMVNEFCCQEGYDRLHINGFKISKEGMEINVGYYSRELYPGTIGGGSVGGVKGYIELSELDKGAFESIEQLVQECMKIKRTFTHDRKDLDFLRLKIREVNEKNEVIQNG